MAEERTGKLEEISIKTIQSEEQRKNNWGGKNQRQVRQVYYQVYQHICNGNSRRRRERERDRKNTLVYHKTLI